MSQAASDAYLNKYRVSSGNAYNYLPESVHHILSQAGPDHIYRNPNYYSSDVARITTEITHHPATYSTTYHQINEDPNPVRLVRPITPVSHRQNIRVRYLEPPDLPEPNPIIIKERQLTPPPPPPPIVIRQVAKPPPTPPPLLIREKPPVKPDLPKTTVIEKIIPPPTPPPRQVIVERIPAPEKPRDIIYEKWLPYKPQPERPVLVERGKIYPRHPTPKNVIIDYEHPSVNVERQLHNEGIIRADPTVYHIGPRDHELRIVDRIHELPAGNEVQQYAPVYRQYEPDYITLLQRPATPKLNTQTKSLSTTTIPRGPISYAGPWNTTYRSSYTGRGYGARK